MAIHSSVLAWRVPGTGEPSGLRLWGHTESDTTEAKGKVQVTLNLRQKKLLHPTQAPLHGKEVTRLTVSKTFSSSTSGASSSPLSPYSPVRLDPITSF